MTMQHEEELAQELKRRGLSRREMLQFCARLGLSGTAMAAVLAACGQVPQQSGTSAAPTNPPATEPTPVSLFDPEEGNSG